MSYLNTLPLVWGFLHGGQQGRFDLTFGLPSECANRLASGEADIGLVPSIELNRQKLAVIRGAGIACHGAVRSILLVSKVPFGRIRKLAADSSSRTSVMLARIVLAREYGSEPEVVSALPDLPAMLEHSDACLIIGDAALLLDAADLPFYVLDLGAEWTTMTGLPMVFAVWAARSEIPAQDPAPFLGSLAYGMSRIEEIVRLESGKRSVSPELATLYLTEHIVFGLGLAEYRGLDLFLEYADQLKDRDVAAQVTA